MTCLDPKDTDRGKESWVCGVFQGRVYAPHLFRRINIPLDRLNHPLLSSFAVVLTPTSHIKDKNPTTGVFRRIEMRIPCRKEDGSSVGIASVSRKTVRLNCSAAGREDKPFHPYRYLHAIGHHDQSSHPHHRNGAGHRKILVR